MRLPSDEQVRLLFLREVWYLKSRAKIIKFLNDTQQNCMIVRTDDGQTMTLYPKEGKHIEVYPENSWRTLPKAVIWELTNKIREQQGIRPLNPEIDLIDHYR